MFHGHVLFICVTSPTVNTAGRSRLYACAGRTGRPYSPVGVCKRCWVGGRGGPENKLSNLESLSGRSSDGDAYEAVGKEQPRGVGMLNSGVRAFVPLQRGFFRRLVGTLSSA